MAKRRPAFNILPIGWDYPAWIGEFYPDDLPSEWRLTYYANEFPGVLIPQQILTALNAQKMRDWDADVGEGFRFYFLINQMVDSKIWSDISDCLKEKFGGLVVDSSCLEACAKKSYQLDLGLKCYTLISKGNLADDLPLRALDKKRIAVPFSARDLTDLRSQRKFMEHLADLVSSETEVLLILDGNPPPINKLRDLRTLAQLLGMA
jgi:hypothetical protein